MFVLGDPGYYRRFGFELASQRGFHFESHDFDAAFQVLELSKGSLVDRLGWVKYHPAFTGGEAAPRPGWSKSRPHAPRPSPRKRRGPKR